MRNEVKDRRYRCRGVGANRDAGALAVRSRLVERALELLARALAHRGLVEPIDALERRSHGRERPFTIRRIGDRDARDVARRIITRDDVVVAVVPAIVIRRIGARQEWQNVLPPRCRIDREGLELDHVSRRARPVPGNAERDGRIAVDVVDAEASLIELEMRERLGGSAISRGHRGARSLDGVARGQICGTSACNELARFRSAEDVGERHGLAGSQVDHSATCRMPRRVPGNRHVDVILVRDERPEDVEHVDLSRDGGAWICLAFVVGAEGVLVGVRAGILVGDARDDRIGEDLHAVAGGDVATVEPLTDELRVVIRAIVVRLVELVESPVVTRERERRTAYARLT